jgi:hypothetical protein
MKLEHAKWNVRPSDFWSEKIPKLLNYLVHILWTELTVVHSFDSRPF